MSHPCSIVLRTVFAMVSCGAGLSVTTSFANQADEIIVTARKKSESLQEVPLSVTAFTAEQLQAQGIRNNYELADFTVNFSTQQQLGRRDDRPVIRGMTAPATRGEPNASYFIDGAFVSGSISTAMLGTVERIEVLRGPQSAQFGRATFSGAINYVTRKPSDVLEGQLSSRAGTHDDYQVGGWFSGPLIKDKLAYLVSANWESFGGEWHNQLAPEGMPGGAVGGLVFTSKPTQGDYSRLGETQTQEITGKLLFTPTDQSELTVKYTYSEGDDGHFAAIRGPDLNCYLPNAMGDAMIDGPGSPLWSASIDAGRGGAFCGTVDPSGQTIRHNLPDLREGVESLNALGIGGPEDWTAPGAKPGTRRKQNRFLLQYDQALGEWDMTARVAYNDDDFDQVLDLDRLEGRVPIVPIFLTGLFHVNSQTESEDSSAEVRFSSPADSSLRGEFGAYYYKADRSDRQRHFPGPALAQFSIPREVETTNTAIFAGLGYDLSDVLTLDVEARYAKDEKDLVAFIADPVTSAVNSYRKTLDLSFKSLTPRFTLTYKPTDDSTFYGLMAKGTKPGDFNVAYFAGPSLPHNPNIGGPITGPEDPRCFQLGIALGTDDAINCGIAVIDEEKAWTYEVGAKVTWLESRVTTNLSLFYIDWKNQGQFDTMPTYRSGGLPGSSINQADTVVVNAGKSRSKGLELETNYIVNDNLFLIANYGFVDAEYLEFNSSLYASITGINDPFGAGNVAGNQLSNNPKHTFIIGAVLNRQLSGSLEGFSRIDFAYESPRMVDETNLLKLGRRQLLNWRVGVETEQWKVTAYVTNLLDDDTPTAASSFINFLEELDNSTGLAPVYANLWTLNPNRGRNWGVELLYRFGE